MIKIYTYGGVTGNGKLDSKGANAFLVFNKESRYESVEFCKSTTNNREELKAIINSLLYILPIKEENSPITLHSDSQYCVKGITDWMHSWKKKNWMRGVKPILNKDLWTTVYNLYSSFPKLEIKWVKGHSGDKWNDYVDNLCTTKIEDNK